MPRRALDPIDAAVGMRLRVIRKSKRMTLQQLASATGMAFQHIHKYESGLRRIYLDVLLNAARALSVNINDFLPIDEAEIIEDSHTLSRILFLMINNHGAEQLVGNFNHISSCVLRHELVNVAKAMADAESGGAKMTRRRPDIRRSRSE